MSASPKLTPSELYAIAYKVLKKIARDKEIKAHKPNDIKRDVVKTAQEIGEKPENLYELYRLIHNEVCEEAKLPETMDFKQG
jgi:hypothetical protein